MSRSPRSIAVPSLVLCLALTTAALGCGGNHGAPCREDDDCAEGLLCCKPAASATVRGSCQASCSAPGGLDAATADASMDAGDSDTSADASMDAGDSGS